MQIQESIIIDASIEEVFAFTSNYEHDVRWRTGVVSMEQHPTGQAQVGTKTREVMRFMGQEMITTGEVTEHEINNFIVFQSIDGPYPVTGFRHVKATPEGTRFTYSLSVELNGMFKLLAPVLIPRFRKQVQEDLKRLQDILSHSSREGERIDDLFAEIEQNLSQSLT